MGAAMPYIVSRNTILSKVEKYAVDPKNLLTSLARLRDGKTKSLAIWEAPIYSDPAFLNGPDGKPKPEAVEEVRHIRVHWLGNPAKATPPDAGPMRMPSNSGPTNATGWWAGWDGDAHEIVRQTTQRAYQVALGIEDAQLANLPAWDAVARCWPITFVWTCGSPMFQGFVIWDRHPTVPGAAAASPDRNGHVTVIFSTPGTDMAYKDPAGVTFPEMANGVLPPERFRCTTESHDMAIIGNQAPGTIVPVYTVVSGIGERIDVDSRTGLAAFLKTSGGPGHEPVATESVNRIVLANERANVTATFLPAGIGAFWKPKRRFTSKVITTTEKP